MIYLFGAITLFVILDSLRGYFTAKNKKRYLIQLFVGLPLIIILLFLFGPFFILSPLKIGYSALKNDNITLYYPGDRMDFAKEMMKQLQEADSYNKGFYKTTYPMPILVATSELDMLRFGSYPKAGGTGNELGINIREGRMSVGKIAHEMSHRNLVSLTGKSAITFPRWFDEGLASYIGKMDDYKKPQDLQDDIKKGVYAKDILNIRGIFGTIQWLKRVDFNKESRVFYGQSYLMVKYLFDKYGQDKVYEFVQSLKNNDFEKAFIQSFGVTEEQFLQEFTNYIQNYTDNPIHSAPDNPPQIP